MDTQQQVAIWREIIGSDASWIAFQNGTCVFIEEPVEDLAAAATEMMRQKGVVTEKSQASPMPLSDDLGWIVAFDFPDMLALVNADEVAENAGATQIGALGLERRAKDAKQPIIIHIEDKRGRS